MCKHDNFAKNVIIKLNHLLIAFTVLSAAAISLLMSVGLYMEWPILAFNAGWFQGDAEVNWLFPINPRYRFCAPIFKLSHPIFMSCGNPPNTNPPRLDLLLLLLCFRLTLRLRLCPPPLLNAHARRGGLNGVAWTGPMNSETGTGWPAGTPNLLWAKKLPSFPPFQGGPTKVVFVQPPQPPFLPRLRLCLLRRVFMVWSVCAKVANYVCIIWIHIINILCICEKHIKTTKNYN